MDDRNKHRIAVVTLGSILSLSSVADERTDALGEALVHDFVTNVVTLQSQFEQSLIDASGRIVETTSGRLEIERPTRFRWSYTDPYEQWLVADGLNIWSYDVDLEQVTVKPQSEALANTPALLLGGSENALEQFDIGETTVEEVTTSVRLEPKDKNSGFERVDLGFVNDELARMVFHDNLDQTTIVVLSKTVLNEPIESSRFEFVVPEGVDVVGTPVTQEAKIP